MIKKIVAPVAALLLIALAFGCGGGASSSNTPKTAGDPAALVDTNWSDPTTNTVYSFKAESVVERTTPQVPTPMRGTYTVNDGRLNITVGFQTVVATWDGNVVAVKGKALVKQ